MAKCAHGRPPGVLGKMCSGRDRRVEPVRGPWGSLRYRQGCLTKSMPGNGPGKDQEKLWESVLVGFGDWMDTVTRRAKVG